MMGRFLRLGVLLAAGAATSSAVAQGPPAPVEDRERIEAEANGQAAEADRLYKAGEFAAALPLYEAERGSRAKLGDLRYEALALRAIGCCRSNLGDDDAAIPAWLAAAKLDARRDDPGFEGYDWLLIGQAHLRRLRLEESIAAIGKALPKLSKAIDRDHEADARLALIDALLRLGRPAEARPQAERVEELARAMDDPRRLALARLGSGLAARASGASALAAEEADDASRAFAELGMPVEQAAAAKALGEALADLDRLDAAVAPLEEAARLHEALDNLTALADDLMVLAAIRADSGDLAAAKEIVRKSIDARRRADDPAGEIDARVALASYQDQSGDREASAATLDEALTIARKEATTTPAERVRLLLLASEVTGRAGHPKRAEGLLGEADREAVKADDGTLRRLVAEARARAEKP